MRIQVNSTVAVLVCGLGLFVASAQKARGQNDASIVTAPAIKGNRGRVSNHALGLDDRLSVIAAALDSKHRTYEGDCSHLVHSVYERAGFAYTYASSSDLYAGVGEFQRIAQPQPGDLVVWRGHVGIVIRPSRHIFFSFMHGGPGIDDYEAGYWRSRGVPRFYRYVK
jgi:cell wall-associated NlpC family hydrolase